MQFDNITIKHAHSNTQKVIQYLQWFNQVLDFLLSNYCKMVKGVGASRGFPEEYSNNIKRINVHTKTVKGAAERI